MRTRHEIRVAAADEAALAAALVVTPAETPLLRVLFRLRGLRASADRPLWEAMQATGFFAVDGQTLGAIGRPWRLKGALRTRDTVSLGKLRAFDEPGWAKLAMDFSARNGVLATETRVLLTDPASRRRFRLYWLVVGPFSGLVRRSWLKAAKRRAESRA